MASQRRTSIPGYEDIKKETLGEDAQGTAYWLDVLNNEESPEAQEQADPEFDTDETAAIPTLYTTSSSKPERPRTLRAGYDRANQRLIVVFRDGTWYEYREVPEEMWQGFQASQSKSAFIESSGMNDLPRGSISPGSLSKSRRVQMASLKNFSKRMYPN